MSGKRRDTKNRILRENEFQRKDGMYEYRYVDLDGARKSVYSWKLVTTDRIPPNKRCSKSLRDLEKEIQKRLFDETNVAGGEMTVIELCERYLATRTGVRPTTEAGYKTVMNNLKRLSFGSRRIDSIRISDAKLFLIDLQKEYGKSYSSIHCIRGVLRPAFQMAVDDDILKKNPFEWKTASVLVDDSHTREAISRKDERRLLEFIKEDKHFRMYYEPIYILFNTGLRISEFCGLTLSDIDMAKRLIIVDHQLQMKQDGSLYTQDTKTKAGERKLPMSDSVYHCFKELIDRRGNPPVEPIINGRVGFLMLNDRARKETRPMIALDWEHIFKRITTKYNKIYVQQMPKVTPHVCRHTYCSNMASSGMNPKTLQYLMGHSDIGVTLNTYTHLGLEAAQREIKRLEEASS